MIDLHCHILPDIDDGPRTIDESVAMAKVAAEDGITTIVATPHLNERPYDPAEIDSRVTRLNEVLDRQNIPLSILPGADVSALFRPKQLEGFTINHGPYILLEFPHTHIPHNAGEILFRFQVKGYRPVITHPERNGTVVAKPSALEKILTEGIAVQITAGSLLGTFGRRVKKAAEHLLHSGLVQVIASDAHDLHHRKPGLSKAVAAASKIVGPEVARAMVCDTPGKMLFGMDFEYKKQNF